MPLTREEAEKAVEKLRIFSQPQRLMILSQLQAGEMTVGEIDAATGIGQPALSQQLAGLRKGGLVARRRASKQVFYRLADAGVEQCVHSIEAQFGGAMPAASPVKPRSPAQPAGEQHSNREAAVFARIVS